MNDNSNSEAGRKDLPFSSIESAGNTPVAALMRASGGSPGKRDRCFRSQSESILEAKKGNGLNVSFRPGCWIVEPGVRGGDRKRFRSFVNKLRKLDLGLVARDITRLARPKGYDGTKATRWLPYQDKDFEVLEDMLEGVPTFLLMTGTDPKKNHGILTSEGMKKSQSEGKRIGRPPRSWDDFMEILWEHELNEGRVCVFNGYVNQLPPVRELSKITGLSIATISRTLNMKSPTGKTLRECIEQDGIEVTFFRGYNGWLRG